LCRRFAQAAGFFVPQIRVGRRFYMPDVPEAAWIYCRSALAREKYRPAISPNLTHRVRRLAGERVKPFNLAAAYTPPFAGAGLLANASCRSTAP
jgi:hypothetical protein